LPLAVTGLTKPAVLLITTLAPSIGTAFVSTSVIWTPSCAPVPPVRERSAMAEDIEDDDDSPLTVSDFHTIAQKQILNAVFSVLSDTKMDWHLVAPFLDAARDVLLGDIEETAQVRIHTVQQDDKGGWAEADEAYLGISVSDRDTGEEWLSDTWWLSELAIAEDDPEQVRAIIHALERTNARLNAWLQDKGHLPATPAA